MILTIPSASGVATGPSSPILTASEDLMRFPSESLHSFSFAQKSDDFLQMRYNVLKRSMDMLREKGLWSSGGLGIASAHAKVTGDQEMQSMMELLNKADLQSSGLNFSVGAMTGPALPTADNPFETSFMGRSESPETIPVGASQANSDGALDESDGRKLSTPSVTIDEAPTTSYSSDSLAAMLDMPSRNPRTALKRTYTDIATLSLQHKLTEALTQPYLAEDNTLLSPRGMNAPEGGAMPITPFPGFQPHAHGRAAPTSQAIFTTETQSPFTITAANDLACLAFGVQRSEIRKLSILDVVREDKRKWLETRLSRARQAKASSAVASLSPPKVSPMGNGVTARLLSKPPSRHSYQGRRTQSDDGSGSSIAARKASSKPAAEPMTSQSRGVLLCGDVVAILKRNGDVGSASVWVQEKRDKLIWVLEEIAEDLAYLSVDEVGCVTNVTGKSEAVWGMERVRTGMDVTRLIPDIPRLENTNTGALDYDKIAELRRFTARTANDINIPITVDQISGESTFRISSFPHMAGMMVLSASTLHVSSSNVVLSEALFGRSPNGLDINELIPGFDLMLDLLVEEDNVQLTEGMVIPEQSFRRARAILALRDGKSDAAAVFLRPNGLPAIHRDGAEFMVDVQMRVVKNEAFGQSLSENVIVEGSEEEDAQEQKARTVAPTVVYALWVTYSRSLHAVNHGVGVISPLVSRPGTPPQQPIPGKAVTLHDDSESDDVHTPPRSSTTSISSTGIHLQPSHAPPVLTEASALPSHVLSPREDQPHKPSISDYVILEDMGAGAYGQVKLARPKGNPGSKVVIKYVTKRRILVDTWTRDRRLGTVPLEVHVLDYLRRDGHKHPNIVEMIDFFEDDTNYYILMKPHGLPGMDLFDYIELRVNMSEDECRRLFRQVASAVEFLHIKAKVVHRDIKDENVILDGEGRIKLIDFGSASYIKNGPFDVFVGTLGMFFPYHLGCTSLASLAQLTAADYAAPEVLSGASYDGLAQDIWALGILLYTILYKENPFYNTDEIMDQDLRVPYIVSEESISLVRGMLERDVEKRFTIREVVNHPWLRQGAEDQEVGVEPGASLASVPIAA